MTQSYKRKQSSHRKCTFQASTWHLSCCSGLWVCALSWATTLAAKQESVPAQRLVRPLRVFVQIRMNVIFRHRESESEVNLAV